MLTGLFVTGTDTEIGKTTISVALLQGLNQLNKVAVGMKPVASGGEYIENQLRNDDAINLIEASSRKIDVPYARVNPYCFEPPIAPHLAAREANVQISIDQICSDFKYLSRQSDFVVVEGVGGWRVPLLDGDDVALLAEKLKLPVVMVVGMRLGALNHALLTVESIHSRGLDLIGWIANILPPEMARLDENINTLKKMINAPCLGVIPWLRDTNNASNHLDWDAIKTCLGF